MKLYNIRYECLKVISLPTSLDLDANIFQYFRWNASPTRVKECIEKFAYVETF